MTELNADQALMRLKEGNRRFITDKTTHPRQDGELRKKLVGGQEPFAIILGCSDSRIPPELIFDQGLGDIFIIRVAGNIIDDVVLGSIEYAAAHLAVPLIMVLGHSGCGAVTATVEGGEVPGHLVSLVEALNPAVEEARGKEGDLVVNAIRANVELMVDGLKNSEPILEKLVGEGKMEVVGAVYDQESGMVDVVV